VSKPYPETTISEQTIYEGKIVHLSVRRVTLENGRESTREIVRHPGAVAILAEPEPGHILFVQQYRAALDKYLLEIPAGKLERGEQPEVCARRELSEETGYQAQTMSHLYSFFTSPGFADEKVHLFYANDLTAGTSHPDEDEFVQIVTRSRMEIEHDMANGRIEDAKTIIAVLWWFNKQASS